jgi:thiamine biosynthesis protein ThiS
MSGAESDPRVRVRVNGEERALAPSTSVADLLKELGVSHSRVAVEFNREILPKPNYPDTLLRDGDSLEVVQFVGGG